MISRTAIDIMATGLQLHPETLRGILSGQRRIPPEALAELARRLDALPGIRRPFQFRDPDKDLAL
ncbi:MAG: hypothetical protein V1792_25440 [Pseudomonadota bacterium]